MAPWKPEPASHLLMMWLLSLFWPSCRGVSAADEFDDKCSSGSTHTINLFSLQPLMRSPVFSLLSFYGSFSPLIRNTPRQPTGFSPQASAGDQNCLLQVIESMVYFRFSSRHGGKSKRKQVKLMLMFYLGFPGGSVVKNPPASVGDAGDSDSILGS